MWTTQLAAATTLSETTPKLDTTDMDPEGNTENVYPLEDTEVMLVVPPPYAAPIFTAIPYDSPSLTTTSIVTRTMVRGTHHHHEETSDTLVANSSKSKINNIVSCKCYSLALGIVIGCFIQLASMGAFFLYRSLIFLTNGVDDILSQNQHPDHHHDDSWLFHHAATTGRFQFENNKRNQIIFSLAWSAFTSTLGVAVVVLLSSLIQRVQQHLSHDTVVAGGRRRGGVVAVVDETLLLYMESHVAMGVVFGLTLTCTIKTFWLDGPGFPGHGSDGDHTTNDLGHWSKMLGLSLWYYLVQFLVVIAVYRAISKYYQKWNSADEEEEGDELAFCCYDDDDVDTDDDDYATKKRRFITKEEGMRMPLLLDRQVEKEEEVVTRHEDIHASLRQDQQENHSYRSSILILGVVVGCFIQLSCLGANYLLLVMWNNSNSKLHQKYGEGIIVVKTDAMLLREALIFNLIWDLFASGLGLIVLLLVRRLLLLQWWSTAPSSSSAVHAITRNILFAVECYFSVGALVGVNLSWVVTNYIMGFYPNMIHSFVMLVVSLVWSRSLRYAAPVDEKSNEIDNINDDTAAALEAVA
jgi:hypothetical protein